MPTINISDEEYKRRVQAIRNLFSRRIHDLYIKCANGEIKTYEELTNTLCSLDHEYTDILEPYGITEDLCPYDFELIRKADDNDEPLKDFAYNWLSTYNLLEFSNVDISNLIPPASQPEEDDDDEDDDDI